MKKVLILILFKFYWIGAAQSQFHYSLYLEADSIQGFSGIHSFAFAQHQNKWVFLAGRTDGLHARQPFNAFPPNFSNQAILLLDKLNKQAVSVPINLLPPPIAEHLSATNLNFFQVEDTLYLIGGYGFSQISNSYVTHNKLTTVQVSGLIHAIEQQSSIVPYFKQISDSTFAVTGGQLGYINGYFYLVGGHQFNGRYNPLGNPTFTQSYTNQVRKFQLYNAGLAPIVFNKSVLTNATHLHRRDFNLIPQVFPNGDYGYTISSGVFQPTVDLPYLYPVDVLTSNGTPTIVPHEHFNQYLSNYHSAKVALFDSTLNQMHALFFGGMSRYFYQNGQIVQDNLVPFVKTISRLSRLSNNQWQEVVLPLEMPFLQGAGAEFIPNLDLPHTSHEVLLLNKFPTLDSVLIGHIVGGIKSTSINPFSNNQTNQTSSDNAIFKVWLIKNNSLQVQELTGYHNFEFSFFPNPAFGKITVEYVLHKDMAVHYWFANQNGQIVKKGLFSQRTPGKHLVDLDVSDLQAGAYTLTLTFDYKYTKSKTVIIK